MLDNDGVPVMGYFTADGRFAKMLDNDYDNDNDNVPVTGQLTPEGHFVQVLGNNGVPMTGHLTPDPPAVANASGDSSSDGVPNGYETPQRKVAVYGLPSLDIAGELRTKLDDLQNMQLPKLMPIHEKNACRPQFVEESTGKGVFAEERALQYALVPVPPPPLPYKATEAATPPRRRTFAPPPGLSITHAGHCTVAKRSQIDNAQARDPAPRQGDVPPPPPPPPSSASGIVISIGSVGHPNHCAGACRFARRKGGCRDAANCLMCHQCQWQRERITESVNAVPAIPISVGTQGHPELCGQPCKYLRRKGGCRNGSSCPDCHQCMWKRQPQEKPEPADANVPTEDSAFCPPCAGDPRETAQAEEAEEVAGMPLAGDDQVPSVGSIGHPYSCSGVGCKYNGKAKGCKDGRFCVRCHLCTWRRYQQGA